jgi:hypothetical protein
MEVSATERRTRAEHFGLYARALHAASRQPPRAPVSAHPMHVLRHALLTHAATTSPGVARAATEVSGNLRITECKSEFDPRTMVTDAVVELELLPGAPKQFDIPALALELDPRRWAELRRADGWTTSDPVTIVAGKPEALPMGPADYGKTWAAGKLHEVFGFHFSPETAALATFDVVLCVDYKVDATEINFKYRLYMPIRSTLFQFPQPGGVDVDSGHLTVTKTAVSAQKTVRFTEMSMPGGSAVVPAFAASPLNFMAPAMVSLGLHEGLVQAFHGYV